MRSATTASPTAPVGAASKPPEATHTGIGLLAWSALQRVGMAGVVASLLWLLVLWAVNDAG